MMKICVCGWYFRPDFYRSMKQANNKYPVTVVCNQPPDIPAIDEAMSPWGYYAGTSFMMFRENIGLEWGAYDHYIQDEWDGESDVLFLHDDIRLRPVMRDYELRPPIEIFEAIEKLEQDQVYIFKSLKEASDNFYIHGRAFKCSARFLRYLRRYNGGFYYDKDNDGHTQGPTPAHCKHFNEADYRFKHFINQLPQKNRLIAGEYVILPALDCARRGRFEEEEEQIRPI